MKEETITQLNNKVREWQEYILALEERINAFEAADLRRIASEQPVNVEG